MTPSHRRALYVLLQMGMNAYFTYSVVGWRGTDDIAFDAAITAILIEGIIFLLLAVTGARQYIAKLIVSSIHYGSQAIHVTSNRVYCWLIINFSPNRFDLRRQQPLVPFWRIWACKRQKVWVSSWPMLRRP